MPYGLGAKMAKPDTQVIVLSGDGSFGMNGMEMDTAVRHNIPVMLTGRPPLPGKERRALTRGPTAQAPRG